ncbi:MAG: cell division protein ZapA [Bacteroidales bacterium]|jgi:cell division protein ZapA (FtsZ GTPase activity inhibitor)|nr:cell division protein ZapA [Bacteroidales bacterium]MBQ1637722.1 cell division protein ZapA [Bacteroidales bacterium]MBQ1754306.1 cell division protein ZapA [Bacteroidales bacterium]MBQ1831437.1 cell division protein ZapA [Bacteroidales bacterium]MBQ2148853.1 cell division protein ZapA [Bacteroidales bacterium]
MKQRITLKIAGKETQHLVDAGREEMIRAAADRINKEIDALRFDFRDQDLSDVLSMLLLSEETKLLELEARSSKENQRALRQLEELDASLGEYLSR